MKYIITCKYKVNSTGEHDPSTFIYMRWFSYNKQEVEAMIFERKTKSHSYYDFKVEEINNDLLVR